MKPTLRSVSSCIAIALVLGALGCGDKAGKAASSSTASAKSVAPSASVAAQPASSGSATAASSAAPQTSATAAADDISTPADFEDDAEKDIGTDNFTEELGRLEKEIKAK